MKTYIDNDGRVSEKMVTNSFRKQHLKHESKANKVNHEYTKLRDRLELNVIFNEFGSQSLKKSNMQNMLVGIQKRVGHNDEVHRKITSKKYLKLKFEAKIAYQRCIDQIANWCIHGYTTKTPFEKQDHIEKRKFVVFGDCSKLSGLKGSSSGMAMQPLKRLLMMRSYHEEFDIRMISEAYTS